MPIQLEVTEVAAIQTVLDGIGSEFGDLGYALVRGNPTFSYSGSCEVTYWIDNEGVRIGGEINYRNIERIKLSEFEDIANLVWQKNIAIESVLDVIDCSIGLGLRYEVQVTETLAMEWEDLTNTSEYDLIIQTLATDTATKVLFNAEVYSENTQVSKVEMVVRYRE